MWPSRARLVAAITIACCSLTVIVFRPRAHAVLATASCSSTLANAAPWNAVCYRSQVPAPLLRSAPFTVIDPRRLAHSLTGLRLVGIYVARLGSNDPNQGHPLGPLLMIDYLFGPVPTPLTHRPAHPFVTVWEDGDRLPGSDGLSSSANGVWIDRAVFPRHRAEIQVIGRSPRRWITTLTGQIATALRSQPIPPAPLPRLYVTGPGTHLTVDDSVTFYVLNNLQIAEADADFELVLRGGWSRPTVLSPYEGGACGGDNIPSLSARTGGGWSINFGDCPEVGLQLMPTRAGVHRLEIRTDEIGVAGAHGTFRPIHPRRLPAGGYVWSGTAN